MLSATARGSRQQRGRPPPTERRARSSRRKPAAPSRGCQPAHRGRVFTPTSRRRESRRDATVSLNSFDSAAVLRVPCHSRTLGSALCLAIVGIGRGATRRRQRSHTAARTHRGKCHVYKKKFLILFRISSKISVRRLESFSYQ